MSQEQKVKFEPKNLRTKIGYKAKEKLTGGK